MSVNGDSTTDDSDGTLAGAATGGVVARLNGKGPVLVNASRGSSSTHCAVARAGAVCEVGASFRLFGAGRVRARSPAHVSLRGRRARRRRSSSTPMPNSSTATDTVSATSHGSEYRVASAACNRACSFAAAAFDTSVSSFDCSSRRCSSAICSRCASLARSASDAADAAAAAIAAADAATSAAAGADATAAIAGAAVWGVARSSCSREAEERTLGVADATCRDLRVGARATWALVAVRPVAEVRAWRRCARDVAGRGGVPDPLARADTSPPAGAARIAAPAVPPFSAAAEAAAPAGSAAVGTLVS